MPDLALERAFFEIAVERGLLTKEARADVERAVSRARGESVELAPWRAAFVRGYLNRAEVDRCLLDATKRTQSTEVPTLDPTAEEDLLDLRFGMLALRTGLVAEEQIEKATALKKKWKELKIGDALVKAGALRPAQRDALLLLQSSIRASRASDAGPPSPRDLVFGTVALENRLVAPRELEAAVAEQVRLAEKGKTKTIGEILVDRGAMTEEARDLVLELRERRATRPAHRAPAPGKKGDDPDAIGRIVLENRLATQEQIDACVELQRELRENGIDRPLGDLLVLKGWVDRGTLDTLLKAQTVRRKAATIGRSASGAAPGDGGATRAPSDAYGVRASPAVRRSPRAVPESLREDSPATVFAAIVVATVLSCVYAFSSMGGLAHGGEPEKDAPAPRGAREK